MSQGAAGELGSGEAEDGAAAEQVVDGAEQMGAVGAMVGRAVGRAGAGQDRGAVSTQVAEIGQTVLGAHLMHFLLACRG